MTDVADEKALALAEEAMHFKTKAMAVLVRSPREYELAAADLKNIKAKYNELESRRVFLKEPVLEQGRRIDGFFKAPLQFLKDAEAAIKCAMLGYQEEERRLAAEEQRKQEEAARQAREAMEAKARAEREEADRIAAEMKRKAQEARERGDLASAATLRHEADQMVEASEEKAVAILDQAQLVVAPKVVAEVPVVQGVSTRTIWRARVVNAKLVPDEYKVVNEKMLQDFAKATKGNVSLPGVEFYPEQMLAQRA